MECTGAERQCPGIIQSLKEKYGKRGYARESALGIAGPGGEVFHVPYCSKEPYKLYLHLTL